MTDATKTPPATGTFCWNECLTTDVEAAKTFYTGLMGWTTREMDMGPRSRDRAARKTKPPAWQGRGGF